MPFRFLYFIALCLFIHPLFGQQVTGKGKLTGILVTSGNDEPMPFATISIYTPKDSLVEAPKAWACPICCGGWGPGMATRVRFWALKGPAKRFWMFALGPCLPRSGGPGLLVLFSR